jgi:hypothetical protein
MNRSAKRLVRVARFAVTLACTATLTILIIRGRDPTFLNFHQRSPAEIALSRVIKRVNFQRIPFYQAIDTLSQAAGIKIECDDAITSVSPYYHNVSLTAEQITLGDALRELLVSASDDQLHGFPEGDRIRVGDAGSAAEAVYVDEYMLPGFIPSTRASSNSIGLFSSGPPPFPLPRLYDYDHMDALDMLPLRADEMRMAGCVGVVWPPHLFVLLPASSHQEVREVFDAFRSRATPQARRKLPFGTDVLDFVDGTFRARDSRAANDALRSVIPVVSIAPQPLKKALESLGAQTGVRIRLVDDLADVVFSEVELNATRITLASALKSILAQGKSVDIDFEPDRDTIWICPTVQPKLFRVFELRCAFAGLAQDESADRLQRVRSAVSRRGHREESYEYEGFVGSVFIIRGTWDELEVYEKSILKCLNGPDSNHNAASP